MLHTRLDDVLGAMGPPPWAKRIIADERQLVTLIATPPGGANRPHWHRDFDEWWVVLAGHLEWELTGGTIVRAAKDDIVWVPRGTVHHIRAVGADLTLRLAVAMPPAMHYFEPVRAVRLHGRRPWRLVRLTILGLPSGKTAPLLRTPPVTRRDRGRGLTADAAPQSARTAAPVKAGRARPRAGPIAIERSIVAWRPLSRPASLIDSPPWPSGRTSW